MVPEKSQAEAKLMNIFDKWTINSLVYFELCIVMDYKTKKPDYKHLIITTDAFYVISQAISEKEPPRTYPFTEVDSIDHMRQWMHCTALLHCTSTVADRTLMGRDVI